MATQYTVPAVQSLEAAASTALKAGNMDDHAYYLDLANRVGELIRTVEQSPRKNASTTAKAFGTQLQQALRGL